jgi:superfamily II DNA/RNA helicase
VKSTMGDRQVVLFSATMKAGTEKLAKEITKEPEILRIEKDELASSGEVEHIYFTAEPRDKIKLLEKIVRLDNIKALAFINDIGEIQIFKEKFNFKELSTGILHSDMKKLERQAELKAFRDGKTKMLIATDVAARGLDIQGVTHVVHVDFPRDIAQYVHRAGRTGRMGANGTVISLVTEREERELKRYCQELNVTPSKRIFFKGQIAEPEQKARR